jgi:hypothetical protein
MAEPRPATPTAPYEERPSHAEQTSDVSSEPPTTAPEEHPREAAERECPECDLKALDDLKCETERITKEASVTEESLDRLNTMRTEFDEAKTAYIGARSDAETALVAIDEQIDRLKSTIECLFEDKKDRVECLKASYETVKQSLAECEVGTAGCCVSANDCEYTWEVPDEELASRIQEYTKKVAKAEACFDELKGEPTALPERVTALQGSVSSVAEDVCADDKKSDWKGLYARFLKVLDDRGQIWHGFEGVAAYVDCLCLALTCVLKGKKALAKLEGQRAYVDCRESAKETRCQLIREHMIEEVIAEYERTCEQQKPQDQSTKTSDKPYEAST